MSTRADSFPVKKHRTRSASIESGSSSSTLLCKTLTSDPFLNPRALVMGYRDQAADYVASVKIYQISSRAYLHLLGTSRYILDYREFLVRCKRSSSSESLLTLLSVCYYLVQGLSSFIQNLLVDCTSKADSGNPLPTSSMDRDFLQIMLRDTSAAVPRSYSMTNMLTSHDENSYHPHPHC